MNLRIQSYLKEQREFDAAAIKDWLDRWTGGAMRSVEALIGDGGGAFCVGDRPGMADAFLVPQVFGALRFGVDLSHTPRIKEIYERCNAIDAFVKAHPQNQPDAVAA